LIGYRLLIGLLGYRAIIGLLEYRAIGDRGVTLSRCHTAPRQLPASARGDASRVQRQ